MDTSEMQRTRYKAKKNGFSIFKFGGGYLLFDKENDCIADKFSLKPQPLSALKNFLVDLEIEALKQCKEDFRN